MTPGAISRYLLMPKKPEAILEDYLATLCAARSWLYFKFTSPSRRGVPDRIIIGNTLTCFVELKGTEKTPRLDQLRRMAQINEAGGIATWVATKEHIDQLVATLDTGHPPTTRRPTFDTLASSAPIFYKEK